MIDKAGAMGVNKLLTMAIAGVIGDGGYRAHRPAPGDRAMVIAPGFQPLVRLALGFVGGSRAWFAACSM